MTGASRQGEYTSLSIGSFGHVSGFGHQSVSEHGLAEALRATGWEDKPLILTLSQGDRSATLGMLLPVGSQNEWAWSRTEATTHSSKHVT